MNSLVGVMENTAVNALCFIWIKSQRYAITQYKEDLRVHFNKNAGPLLIKFHMSDEKVLRRLNADSCNLDHRLFPLISTIRILHI